MHCRNHYEVDEATPDEVIPPTNFDDNSDDNSAVSVIPLTDSEDNSGVSISNFLKTLTETLQRHLALFSLKLQEKHVVQRTVQTEVISQVEALFNFFHEKYKGIYNKCLDNLNIDITNPQFIFLNDFDFVEHCYK